MLDFDMQRIGNKLYELRKRKGLTQAKCAEKAGLSDRTYADIERGSANMRMETLFGICNALGITPDEILIEKKDDAPVLKQEIIDRIQRCSEKELQTLLKLMDVYLTSLERERTTC